MLRRAPVFEGKRGARAFQQGLGDKEAETKAPRLVLVFGQAAPPAGNIGFADPIHDLRRKAGAVVEALSREQAGRLKVLKLNVDDNPVTANRYRVQSIPTLLLIKDGQVAETVVGALPKGALEARLAPHLKAAPTA